MFTPEHSAKIKAITPSEVLIRVKPKYRGNKLATWTYNGTYPMGSIASRMQRTEHKYTLMDDSSLYITTHIGRAHLQEDRELGRVRYRQYQISLQLYPPTVDTKSHLFRYIQYLFDHYNPNSQETKLSIKFDPNTQVLDIQKAKEGETDKFLMVSMREDEHFMCVEFVSTGVCNKDTNVVEQVKKIITNDSFALRVPRQDMQTLSKNSEWLQIMQRGRDTHKETKSTLEANLKQQNPMIVLDDLFDFKLKPGVSKPVIITPSHKAKLARIQNSTYSSTQFVTAVNKGLSIHNIGLHSKPSLDTKALVGVIRQARSARTPASTELKLVIDNVVTANIRKRTTTVHNRFIKFHKGVLLMLDGFNPSEYEELILSIDDPNGGGHGFLIPTTNWFCVPETNVSRLLDKNYEEVILSYSHTRENKYHKTPYHFAAMSNALVGKFIPTTPTEAGVVDEKYVPIVYIEAKRPDSDRLKQIIMDGFNRIDAGGFVHIQSPFKMHPLAGRRFA